MLNLQPSLRPPERCDQIVFRRHRMPAKTSRVERSSGSTAELSPPVLISTIENVSLQTRYVFVTSRKYTF